METFYGESFTLLQRKYDQNSSLSRDVRRGSGGVRALSYRTCSFPDGMRQSRIWEGEWVVWEIERKGPPRVGAKF